MNGSRGAEMRTLETAIGQFANIVLANGGKAPTVAIGPLVWDIKPGHDTKHWYFHAASADTAGRFHVDRLTVGNDQRLGEEARSALMQRLIERAPLVLHDFDDELMMARFCEDIWPCDKTRRLRTSLEQERER